jgi:ABC-2 type transport system permease protein
MPGAMPPGGTCPQPRPVGRVQWLGAWTLFLREMRRYFKEGRDTILAPAFQALVYFVVLVFALGPDRGTDEGEALLSHAVPGLVLMSVLFRSTETTAFSLLYDRMEGIISDVLMAPLGPAETTAAYALAGAASGLVTGGVVLVGAMLAWPISPAHPWALPVFAALSALMMSLTGVLLGLHCEKWDHLAAAFVFVLTPLTVLSGVFVPVDQLPAVVASVIRLNPVFHAIDGFRYGFLGTSTSAGAVDPALSLAVVAGTAVVLWACCGVLIHRGYKLKP